MPPSPQSAPPPPDPPHPRPARWKRLLASAARVAGGCVLVLAIATATVGLAKLYGHARRQATPIIIPPDVRYEDATRPALGRIATTMLEMAGIRLRWMLDLRPRTVALTFDDGPYAMLTPMLLDLLKRQGVHATFFIEGKDAQMYPELVRRIADEGHELGNHSYTHASLIGLDAESLTRELRETDELIRCLTGVAPPIMRPPGGRLDPSRFALVQRLGYTVVNDNDNPGDYREADPRRLYDYVLNHSSRSTVVCLHSGRLVTIRALSTIIAAYRQKGYRFVTISELARIEGTVIPPLPDHSRTVSASTPR